VRLPPSSTLFPYTTLFRSEQTGGFPTLDVAFDRDAIARYGLSLQEVTDTVATAMGGREAGLVFEGDRRFDVVVRLPDAVRDDLRSEEHTSELQSRENLVCR